MKCFKLALGYFKMRIALSSVFIFFTLASFSQRTDTLYLPYGQTYWGNVSNGKQNGNGIMLCTDGKFTGEFKNGKKEGNGTMEYKNGSIYKGHWKNDFPNGTGLCIYSRSYTPLYR